MERAIVADILDKGSQKEFFEAVYPPKSSNESLELYSFMKSHITLSSNGMGVYLKHDRYEISKLLEDVGFEYLMVENFIRDYEDKLLEQYYKEKEKNDL